MRKNLPFSPVRATGFFHIIEGFCLNGYEYWIINLTSTENHPKSDAATFHHTSSLVEIRRFEVDGQLFAIVRAESPASDIDRDAADLLTERELQIATLVAMGRLNKQIADKLRISGWTVATHLRRIFAKLGVNTRAAMVHRCASLISQRRS